MDPRYTTQIPNFYNNQITTMPPQMPYQNNYSIPYQNPQINTTPSLYGRVVDSKDMLKVIDVPMGTTGIFPKADLSEIYIKRWTETGTTVVNTYRLVNETTETEEKNSILAQMAVLNDKVDKLISELGS